MSERIRKSIPISGINTAIPSHMVKDGALDDILNLRYKNGAFVNVFEPKIIYRIKNDNGFKIVYQMEVLGPNGYIAIKGLSVHLVVIEDESLVSKYVICTLPSTIDLKFAHFGSILYINHIVNKELQEQSFIYKDETFSQFSIDDIEPPDIDVICNYEDAGINGIMPGWVSSLGKSLVLKVNMRGRPKYGDVELSSAIGSEIFEYNLSREKLEGRGLIMGDFYVMVAYKLFDGSIIKPSKPIRVSSFGPENSEVGILQRETYWENNNDTFEIYYVDAISGVSPTLVIRNSYQSNDIVKGLVVLSTRPELVYDYDDIHHRLASLKGTGFHFGLAPVWRETLEVHRNFIVDKSKLQYDQPYYEIANIETNVLKLHLTYGDHYKDIEHNIPFKPSFSLHSITSGYKFEYNNRLHLADIWLRLFQGYSIGAPLDPGKNDLLKPQYFGSQYNFASLTMALDIDVELTIEHEVYNVHYTTQPYYMLEDAEGSIYAAVNYLVCYPDARANKIRIHGIYGNNKYKLNETLTLKKSLANNTSYAYINDINVDHDYIPTYVLIKLSPLSITAPTTTPTATTRTIRQKNKLYVSAFNNPFFVDPANIYSIGSANEVITEINTATEQITETKFGAFPLYVFSDRAIHALEVGTENVLYSKIIGVSNDAKVPSTGTIGAVNLVFFISDKGVMVLEGRRIECVSLPLETCPGEENDMNFTTYCANGNLGYNPIESEIILYNTNYDYAYIYSLEGRIWGRRDWKNKVIDGNSRQLIVTGKGIASAWFEDKGKPVFNCLLRSRPLKLDSLEFKRLETLVARASHGIHSIFEMSLDGSNDLRQWNNIGYVTASPVIRRTGVSCKYFRIYIRCAVKDFLSITNFDAEYYNRFIRKLR